MRDYFNLDTGAFRQRGDLDGGSRRKVRGEVFGIDLVHPGEIREVRHVHCALDDIGEGQLLVVEDGLHVLQDAVGLGLDVTRDEIPGGRINGDLAGAEQQVLDAHGVIVGSDCGRGLGWLDNSLRWHCGVMLPLCPAGSSGGHCLGSLNPLAPYHFLTDTCAGAASTHGSSSLASISGRS